MKYRRVLGWLEELSGTPVEATALGNVLLQARTAGALKTLGELRQVVRASSTMQCYEPQDRTAWDAAYERFLALPN